jgi:hypothetical protein
MNVLIRLAGVAASLVASSLPLHAQPDDQPATPSVAAPAAPAGSTSASAPAPTASAAADALKKQAGDVDQSSLLKDTLTKQDRQYSLLRAGRISTNYDLTYQYIGTEALNVGYSTAGAIDLFKVENTRSHTVTNSISIDYGLLDNLTVTSTLPLVSKYTQSEKFSGEANAFGDVSFGARYQPFVQSPTGPTFTLTSALSLPTGRSPFKVDRDTNLSTGNGYATGTVGVNASQVMDPVALYGSVNYTLADSANHLHQVNDVDGSVLTGVRPGRTIGFGAGFTYALSYNVSTSVSFQENVTSSSRIQFVDSSGAAQSRLTAMQVAAIMNFGLGLRLSPKTTVNLSAGIGLTTDSPDFSLGLDVPLTFSMF